MIGSNRKVRSVVIVLALASTSVAIAQSITSAEAKKRLTGGENKDWILTRFETILGSDDACKKGEIWRFGSDGRVDILKCVNKKTRHETKKWLIKQDNNLDLAVVVGNQKYTLLLPKTKAGGDVEEMHLRIVSTTPKQPTSDLKFTHERD